MTVAGSAAETTSPVEEHARLRSTWGNARGLFGWLQATTHQTIGKRYIITAFIFLLIGGVEALLMRTQLIRPENGFLGPVRYNQIFTLHGTTMMFLFAVPVMEGLGVYLVPMMLGTRNVAFPRLNAFGYWIYLFGGLLLYGSAAMGVMPDAGWFAYPPLAGPEYSAGKGVDVWAQMITFTEISALCVAVELIATIFRMRAPGMTLSRMPLFCWSMLCQSFMILFAMPAVMLASTVLLLNDRTIGTHFVNPAESGDPMLYQHLFWFFGHPEVYIIFIPALGAVSSIIEAHAGRRVFGYSAIVMSMVANAFLAFGLWVHHMFATDMPQIAENYFTIASMMIAITSGVQIFCWTATLWSGRVRMSSALMFVLGFFFIFILGGMTGVMLAAVPLDLQAHDTFFVVAHFHYVLIGGALFPLIGGIHFWYSKFTGRMIDERLGTISFWLLFLGFNLTFFPMHLLGLEGMPRRVYTYPAAANWSTGNLMATVGAFTIAAGGALFLMNVFRSKRTGAIAGRNPWHASTLEWATASPPENFNFVRQPVVYSGQPLWDAADNMGHLTGMRTDRREVIVTTLLEAQIDHRYILPGSSFWPLLTAVGLSIGLYGSVMRFDWYYVCFALGTIGFIGWFWPNKEPEYEA